MSIPLLLFPLEFCIEQAGNNCLSILITRNPMHFEKSSVSPSLLAVAGTACPRFLNWNKGKTDKETPRARSLDF